MQTTIQPELVRATAICGSCGTSYDIRSTKPELRLDVCAACHPAYTGEERKAVTGSRVERFERKWRRSVAATAKPATATERPGRALPGQVGY